MIKLAHDLLAPNNRPSRARGWKPPARGKIYLGLFIVVYLLIFPTLCKAQEMSSQNYTLQQGSLNTTSGVQTSSGFRLTDLVGQTSAEIFTSKGYIINSGFLNKAASSSLTFSVSPSSINFGTLAPNHPLTNNLLLTVNVGNVPGFSLYTAQSKSLSTEAGSEIPDTICDAIENKICTINKGNVWTKDSSYGFGYSLKNSLFFSFPNLSKKEEPALIMESHEKQNTQTAGMILKINISPNQPVGVYQNVLTFNALPGI